MLSRTEKSPKPFCCGCCNHDISCRKLFDRRMEQNVDNFGGFGCALRGCNVGCAAWLPKARNKISLQGLTNRSNDSKISVLYFLKAMRKKRAFPLFRERGSRLKDPVLNGKTCAAFELPPKGRTFALVTGGGFCCVSGAFCANRVVPWAVAHPGRV